MFIPKRNAHKCLGEKTGTRMFIAELFSKVQNRNYPSVHQVQERDYDIFTQCNIIQQQEVESYNQHNKMDEPPNNVEH